MELRLVLDTQEVLQQLEGLMGKGEATRSKMMKQKAYLGFRLTCLPIITRVMGCRVVNNMGSRITQH